MLKVVIPPFEEWDPVNECFVSFPKEQTLSLEHSLVSISKWESKWHKAFLGKQEKTAEEIIDYIRCMTVTQNVDPEVYLNLPNSVIEQINSYIDDPATATTFYEDNNKRGASRETITSELIYYWMITFGIPFECQKWHLNRLLTLIRVCSIKNSTQKKMGPTELAKRNTALNAARRKAHHTRG